MKLIMAIFVIIENLKVLRQNKYTLRNISICVKDIVLHCGE